MKNYYLIVDNEVFAVDTSFERLRDYIYDFNIHTKFYRELIVDEKSFNSWFDWHSGLWSSGDELLDKDGNSHDIYIIEEFYIPQYSDIEETVNKYREKNNLPLLGKD